MSKKILQVFLIVTGILSSTFTVFATEGTNQVEESNFEKGWIFNEKGWQYKDECGNVLTDGWWQIEGKYYYFDTSGYMSTDWQYINGKYYWFGNDGEMRTGWQEIRGKWYYLGDAGEGAMSTHWDLINGKYYWFGDDGGMRTGWQEIWDKWYYLCSDGSMASNTWVGDYYLNGSGAMETNAWIGNYYVGADGKWIQDISTIYEMEVFNIVNKERVSNGLEPLEYDYEVAKAADVRAKELEQKLSHERPDGTLCFTVLEEFGIEYWACGENIAAGQRSSEQVMKDWMNSPGHRGNIMGAYTHIGVGYYVDKSGRSNWVQLFINK